MAKWITAAIFAALFFSVGLLAGHSVPFTKALATGVTGKLNPGFDADQKPASDIPVDSTASDDATPTLFISHAAASEKSKRLMAEPIIESASRDVHRTAIRDLIYRHFPNTDAAAAGIWVETFTEMSLDEITVILEQKRLTSEGIGAGLSASFVPSTSTPSLTHTVLPEPLPSKQEQAGDVAVRVVEANLRSAYSLGFRRMVVLPEAVSRPESRAADKPRRAPVTCFRSFESGTLIGSPIATHVALTKENSTMFCLEGNRLTRRGDFQLLADRRLGIVTSSEELAAAESTPLPEGATDVQISPNGIIHFRNPAGETEDAGRITVCSVTDLADLQSDDGVFFVVSHAAKVTRRDDASAFLQTHMLEHSNVDRSYENALLTYLKSLSDPFVE